MEWVTWIWCWATCMVLLVREAIWWITMKSLEIVSILLRFLFIYFYSFIHLFIFVFYVFWIVANNIVVFSICEIFAITPLRGHVINYEKDLRWAVEKLCCSCFCPLLLYRLNIIIIPSCSCSYLNVFRMITWKISHILLSSSYFCM